MGNMMEDVKDSLGQRMKDYEKLYEYKLMPTLPALIRLDGVCFHSFTRDMARPFDEDLSKIMYMVLEHLMKETNARFGYTQSDEISLLLYSDDAKSQIYFDGDVKKIISVLAAKASVYLNMLVEIYMRDKMGRVPVMDCRAWNVPSKAETANYFIWRELDAVRNSVSMAASSVYSHQELYKKNNQQKQDMLFEKGINWNNYPSYFKRGTYVQRCQISLAYSGEKLDQLPPLHEVRANPDLKVVRTVYRLMDISLLRVTNQEEVLFDGVTPELEQQDEKRNSG